MRHNSPEQELTTPWTRKELRQIQSDVNGVSDVGVLPWRHGVLVSGTKMGEFDGEEVRNSPRPQPCTLGTGKN